jgi:hypothetical protein
MEIVEAMPNGHHDSGLKWDEIGGLLEQGRVIRFTPGEDYEAGKEQSFRSTLYLRMGQRRIKVKTSIRPEGIYLSTSDK